MRKRWSTRRLDGASAVLEEDSAGEADVLSAGALKRKKVVDLKELMSNKTLRKTTEARGTNRGVSSSGEGDASVSVCVPAEREDKEARQRDEGDENRYSRRRRKPAQPWWIASGEKDELLKLAPLGSGLSSSSSPSRSSPNRSKGSIKSKIRSHLKNFQRRRNKLKSKQKHVAERTTKQQKFEGDERLVDHDISDNEDYDDEFALEPLTPSPTVRGASKTGGSASPSMRPLYVEKKSERRSKSVSPKAKSSDSDQKAMAMAKDGERSEDTSTLLKNPLDEAEEDFKRLKSNTINAHQGKVSTSGNNKPSPSTSQEEEKEEKHFPATTAKERRENTNVLVEDDEGQEEGEGVVIVGKGKENDKDTKDEATRSLGYVGRSFINCIEGHDMFGKKCTLVHYNASSRVWTLQYEEGEGNPSTRSEFVDWFDLLDLLSYEFCDHKGKRGVVQKIQEMKQRQRQQKEEEEAEVIGSSPARATRDDVILEDALDSNIGACKGQPTEMIQSGPQDAADAEEEVVKDQQQQQAAGPTRCEEDRIVTESPMAMEEGLENSGMNDVDLTNPSAELFLRSSPQQLNTSLNFVKTMCTLWEEEEDPKPPRESDGLDLVCVSTPILKRGNLSESNRETNKAAADVVGRENNHHREFQEQTSSDQQLMDLLATPRSTEVTPESKPNSNSNSNSNSNMNDSSSLLTASNQQDKPVEYTEVDGSHPILVIPRQILSESIGADKAAATAMDSIASDMNTNTGGNNNNPILSKNSGARKKLRLCCDKEHKEYLENELCNLLINKKIIKHWREGNDWASKDVTGKELDAYRIAELEERLLSTAREARALMSEKEIGQISKRAHQLWTQLKVKYSCENKSPQRPIKGILKDPLVAKTRPTNASNKKVTFLTEIIEFGSPMKAAAAAQV